MKYWIWEQPATFVIHSNRNSNVRSKVEGIPIETKKPTNSQYHMYELVG